MNWLNQFRETAKNQSWASLADVRKSFRHADGVKLTSGNVVTVFNVKGNEYRLLTRIKYAIEVVEILAAMTHNEYDEERWKQRY